MKRPGGLERLLVPLDGSGLARKALEAALEIAKLQGASVRLLHVVPRLEEYARHASLFEPLARELDRLGREVVEDAAKEVRSAGLEVEVALAHGYPAEEIVAQAEAHDISLIAMGSRGLTTAGSHVLGSVSYQVAMRAPCPVLVAKTAHPFDRVLLAVDGSADAARATELVASLGARSRTQVLLAFIVPARAEGTFTLAAAPAEPFLLETERRLEAARLRVTRLLRYGHPAQEILRAAEKVDLVVMGARGRSDLAIDYVGSVADKVLRNTQASVLVAR
jgi:nucleotide-binding universal stress UspA family protein